MLFNGEQPDILTNINKNFLSWVLLNFKTYIMENEEKEGQTQDQGQGSGQKYEQKENEGQQSNQYKDGEGEDENGEKPSADDQA